MKLREETNSNNWKRGRICMSEWMRGREVDALLYFFTRLIELCTGSVLYFFLWMSFSLIQTTPGRQPSQSHLLLSALLFLLISKRVGRNWTKAKSVPSSLPSLTSLLEVILPSCRWSYEPYFPPHFPSSLTYFKTRGKGRFVVREEEKGKRKGEGWGPWTIIFRSFCCFSWLFLRFPHLVIRLDKKYQMFLLKMLS